MSRMHVARHTAGRTRRRIAAGAISWLVAMTAATFWAAPVAADDAGATSTEVQVFSTGHFGDYGDIVGLVAIVEDASDSCHSIFNDCETPAGHVDFYAVVGATQTFLTSGHLYTDLDATYFRNGGWYTVTDRSIDTNLLYCCLEPGTYTIRGYYVSEPNAAQGDTFDPSSDDATGTTTIAKAGTDVSVTQSTDSTAYGQEVTFHAHVQSATSTDARAAKPSGFISIREGTTNYGTAAVDANGDATIKTSLLPAGSNSLTAGYAGDSRYSAGSSDPIDHTVTAGATSSSLGASSTSITYGDSVTLTDTVTGVAPAIGTPTGSVTFADGGSTIGSDVLNEGDPNTASLTTDSLAAGSHSIAATYDGDSGFDGSTSNTVTITVAKADTQTSLLSSVNPSTFGQAVTFTASVGGPGSTTPTGSVQFKDGGSNIGGPQPVVAGSATLTIQTLAGGSHTITAAYSGSGNYNGSSSSPLVQSVTCDRLITGSVSSLTTTSGSTCLSGAKVTGTVTVNGGSLSLYNSTVSGGLTINGGASTAAVIGGAPVGVGTVTICKSTITGNLSIQGATGFVLVGDPIDDACPGNWLKGTVLLAGNHGGLALDDNRIGGSVTVRNNDGAGPAPDHEIPEVEANSIGGYLSIANNSPAVIDEGRPNRVRGQIRAS